MARRKAPSIPDELLDQLLAGRDPQSALTQGGVLDELKRAFAERALNAEMDHHLAEEAGEGGDNRRNGNGRTKFLTLPTRPTVGETAVLLTRVPMRS